MDRPSLARFARSNHRCSARRTRTILRASPSQRAALRADRSRQGHALTKQHRGDPQQCALVTLAARRGAGLLRCSTRRRWLGCGDRAVEIELVPGFQNFNSKFELTRTLDGNIERLTTLPNAATKLCSLTKSCRSKLASAKRHCVLGENFHRV
jgi:hypothetical protein